MDIKLALVFISLVTALIMAYLNYRLAQKNNLNSKNNELQTQAYIDFIGAISESAMSAQDGKNRPKEITKKL